MEEEAEDSDDEEYQLLGMDFWPGNVWRKHMAKLLVVV
jgi:hypothetical protein